MYYLFYVLKADNNLLRLVCVSSSKNNIQKHINNFFCVIDNYKIVEYISDDKNIETNEAFDEEFEKKEPKKEKKNENKYNKKDVIEIIINDNDENKTNDEKEKPYSSGIYIAYMNQFKRLLKLEEYNDMYKMHQIYPINK